MSITGAMSNALSGLTVTARSVENTSNNVANALTEGFARRELEISARNIGNDGQGVRVVGINRMVNMTLVGDRRVADATNGEKETLSTFFNDLGTALGETGEGSLLGRISSFESALSRAASRPESAARQADVLSAAKALATGINEASQAVQDARTQADADIAAQVDKLNTTLSRVKDLNTQITAVRTTGRDTSALEDERQALVDSIAGIVPIREVQRENGQIALFTTGGPALLDGSVADIGFSPTPVVTPYMSLTSVPPLSGLTLNGKPISVSGEASLVGGGSLTAAFAVRDELAPAQQTQLDAVARNLIERLSDPAVDTTLAAGESGLFNDDGLDFVAANELGLAGRISVNAAVDPDQGGSLWRLRDGVKAAVESTATGDATLLNALGSTLSTRSAAASGPHLGSYSFSGLATQAVSSVSTAAEAADQIASFASSRRDELHALELADGVDTDQEMEHLLRLQEAYAANAKVISACDDLLNHLLEM